MIAVYKETGSTAHSISPYVGEQLLKRGQSDAPRRIDDQSHSDLTHLALSIPFLHFVHIWRNICRCFSNIIANHTRLMITPPIKISVHWSNPIATVLILIRMVKRNVERPKLPKIATIRYFQAWSELPNMSGKRGSTHGASIVRNQENNAKIYNPITKREGKI